MSSLADLGVVVVIVVALFLVFFGFSIPSFFAILPFFYVSVFLIVSASLFINQGIRCITDDGSFSPAMDKPEQALDYVHEAVEACGLTLGSDIHIIINCAATDYYDHVSGYRYTCVI